MGFDLSGNYFGTNVNFCIIQKEAVFKKGRAQVYIIESGLINNRPSISLLLVSKKEGHIIIINHICRNFEPYGK